MSLSQVLGFYGFGSNALDSGSGIFDAGTSFFGELLAVIGGNLFEWGS